MDLMNIYKREGDTGVADMDPVKKCDRIYNTGGYTLCNIQSRILME